MSSMMTIRHLVERKCLQAQLHLKLAEAEIWLAILECTEGFVEV